MKKKYTTPATHVTHLECYSQLLNYSVNDYNEKGIQSVGDLEE